MELKIENCKDIQFILYLLRYIKRYIIASVEPLKLSQLDFYIANLSEYQNELKKPINCINIIRLGADNLTYYKYNGDKFIIKINPNPKIFGLDVKVESACRLINYGTLNVKGYPIFTEAFKHVEENLHVLNYKYIRGL